MGALSRNKNQRVRRNRSKLVQDSANNNNGDQASMPRKPRAQRKRTRSSKVDTGDIESNKGPLHEKNLETHPVNLLDTQLLVDQNYMGVGDNIPDLINQAQDAYNKLHEHIYPPLPMINNEAIIDPALIDPAIMNSIHGPTVDLRGNAPSLEVQDSADVSFDPSLNEAEQAPENSALEANTNNVPVLSFLYRQVPHYHDAFERLLSTTQNYEDKIRHKEGVYRSLLHHYVILTTGLTSARARNEVDPREILAFDQIKADLKTKIPAFDWDRYELEAPHKSSPIRFRLHHLFYLILAAQYERWGAVGPDQLTCECELEARQWTWEQIKELERGTRLLVRSSEHLTTSTQMHLEIPATGDEHL